MDSLIRLRQLNQNDLSGYISQILFPILRTSGLNVSGLNLIPSGSGLFDLGIPSNPFGDIYAENFHVPSGSGIFFGNTLLNAYTSGTNAIIQVGGFTLTSSPQGLSIIGPTGPTGPSGAIGLTGPTGVSGNSITGATPQSGGIRFLFSNGTSGKIVPLPTGATGASVTGFFQSGNNVRPLYSNGTSGSFITLASGAQGPQGDVGAILFDFGQMTGVITGDVAPTVNAPNLDPNSNGFNPSLRMIKGMRYKIGVSGLNLTTFVSPQPTGFFGIPPGTYKTNFFTDEQGITGYLRFCIWDTSVDTDFNVGTTGRFVNNENGNTFSFSDISSHILDDEVMTNVIEDPYHGSISFNVNFGAQSDYRYGFVRYYANGVINDGSIVPTFGAYVIGDLEVDYFGPAGPAGTTGPRGLDGPQGEPGVPGVGGNPGVGITGVARNPLDGTQIRFLFSDNTVSDYVTLPAGGPTGPTGPAGTSIIGPSGSTGPQGLTGPQGAAGNSDTFYTNFLTTDINATSGISPSFNKITSGSSNWVYTTGNNMFFNAGDEIQFQANALIDKAYSPWQSVVFADNNFFGARYFYAWVQSYNPTAGILSFLVQGSPYSPVGLSGGHFYWNQFNSIALNLGGLGSPGSTGPTGPQGSQGAPGDTGNAVFIISPLSGISAGVNSLDCIKYSAWNLTIPDGQFDNYLNFNLNRFSTGETVQLKVSNLGTLTPDVGLVIHWDSSVKFPYGVPAPAPQPNQTNVYTFVRYPDIATNPQIFCTYSVNYLV